ncbi:MULTISPECIES: phosphate-starvation-inducible PsiE family protein [unclassified Enterococcus]|uniref:phosphate-starvation-inducible PsiE family protein n=1 Tax=unclassified Enterococcus TaxID=2608891 RepID=UPI001556F034|nr:MULTISPECIES: phosphate-starvation-inducible PsiE family protein [unclassified Enterococcus]MBS7577028.1 phosphate-starvation-inducible PsiE family protein [Enterococcus sp. MMGLQ5-2]MBS7584525.1 phosphate-starvation-inducible PsiE family protein [Enterococcus sp. MMGLQ5-1]NPD12380.1 phosphate-starvation-inducible protein PsiE [Enterococcus sp. MMGLQ5-1]NPD36862.1 phosphate-starvation-inducible protein PsiE [Enterococcus sp. MMGLQ5-2]
MKKQTKATINFILDIFLITLAGLLLIVSARELYEIFQIVISLGDKLRLEAIIRNVLTFFMTFEFIMLIFRYLQENHHIPIRYLIYICVTAVLRQILSDHDAGQILLLSLSILILIVTLILLQYAVEKIRGRQPQSSFDFSKLSGKDEDQHH